MARDFWLALTENPDKIADADLAAVYQVEQARARGVGQRGKKAGEFRELRTSFNGQFSSAAAARDSRHNNRDRVPIISALTNMNE